MEIQRRYVAMLRAITNVSMKSFREQMEDLGLTDVESLGSSGNLIFTANCSDSGSLERQIAARFHTAAVVRSHRELAQIVTRDPFGAHILFLARAPTAARRRTFLRLEFEMPSPELRGKTVFFVHPARLRGKRTPFDFERALGIQGTARSARVVRQLLARLSKEEEKD